MLAPSGIKQDFAKVLSNLKKSTLHWKAPRILDWWWEINGWRRKCLGKNCMSWPKMSEVLNLHLLEDILISHRIPCIGIREHLRGSRSSAKGNIILTENQILTYFRGKWKSVTFPVKLKIRSQGVMFSKNIHSRLCLKL